MADIRLGNLGWKNNTEPVSPTNPWHSKDVNSDAIKNKVDTLATETKLEQVRTLLAGVATEDKLEQARALLQTISGKDFATQTTLAQVKSELELVKAELQAIKANQLSGDQKVTLSGQIPEPQLRAFIPGSGSVSRFFDNDFVRLEVKNDSDEELTVNVAGIHSVIKGYESLKVNVRPTPSFSIVSDSASYRVLVYGMERLTEKVPENLFDLDAAVPGLLSVTSGNLNASGSNMTSDWIAVEPDTAYTLAIGVRICFYRENKSFISAIDNIGVWSRSFTYITPPDCEFVRFSQSNTRIGNVKMYEGYEIPEV